MIRLTVFGLLVVDGGDRTDLIHIGPQVRRLSFLSPEKSKLFVLRIVDYYYLGSQANAQQP